MGNLYVNNILPTTGSLVTFENNVKIKGTLSGGSPVEVSGGLNVSGTMEVSGGLNVSGTFEKSGSSVFYDTTTFSGSILQSGSGNTVSFMDNVGIGTASPNCRLHVAGAAAFSGPSETFVTFGSSDTTPSVATGNLFKTHASSQTLTTFDDGVAGQTITVISTGAVIFDVSGTLKGGSTNITTASGDITVWTFDGTNWYLQQFMDVSADMSSVGGGEDGDVVAGSTFTTAGVIMACDGDDKTIDEPGATLTTNSQGLTVSGVTKVGASAGSGQDLYMYTAGTAAHVGVHWDADGNTEGTLIGGADNHGVDFKFFGETTGKYVQWDMSADALVVLGTVELGHASDTTIARASSGQITVEGTAVLLAGAQTGITSVLATDLVLGEDAQTKIDFETANEIHFYTDNAEQVYVSASLFGPQTDSSVDLGTTGVRWKDAYIDSVTTTGNVLCSGEVQTANIGYTDGDNALTIADGGGVTAAAGLTSTAAANTFGATSFNDADVTNVGDIALDSISADGTDINIAVSDNSATALTIKQGSDAYLIVDTANSSESVSIGTGISGTAISIGHSTSETTINDNLTVTGDLTVSGATTTVDSTTIHITSSFTFEGTTPNAHETVLGVVDPTADATFKLPALSAGTYYIPALAGTATDASSAVTAAEFALLDGGSSVGTTAVANGDGIFTNDAGTMKHTTVQTFQTYFDANSVGGGNMVTVGALNAGSVTSGFGNIDNGSSTLDTGVATVASMVCTAGATFGGGIGSSGVTITTAGAVSADGRIVTDDTTAATSTTDGSLQTDGGLSVALDAVIGDDLILLSNSGSIHFGADKEITLTHAEDTGLILASSGGSSIPVFELKNTNNDAAGAILKFNKDGANAADDDVLGDINFVGENDAGTPEAITYAYVRALSEDVTDGEEDGSIILNALVAGSARDIVTVGNGTGVVLPNNSTYGTVKANAFITYSDETLKHDIATLENPLDKVLSMRGVSYTWNSDSKADIGFIAQEIQEIVPEVVYKAGNQDTLGIDYASMTALLVEAVKEQQEQITDLKTIIDTLKNKLKL